MLRVSLFSLTSSGCALLGFGGNDLCASFADVVRRYRSILLLSSLNEISVSFEGDQACHPLAS